MLRFLTSLLTLFVCSSLFGQSVQQQFETMIIERIDVVVNNAAPGTQFNANSVLSRIRTQPGRTFSQSEFDNDLKVLAQDYDDVEPIVEVLNNRLHITLSVSLKPVIRSIQWVGNCAFTSGKLQSELNVKPGTIYEKTAFNRCFNDLRKFYVKKGFFESELTYDVCYDNVTNEVDINILICEGRSGKIQDIIWHNFMKCEINDLEDKLLTKEYCFFTSWLDDSGVYNEEMMMQDQMGIINYLQNRGFADADVTIDIEESCTNRIVIHITADRGECYSIGNITIEGNCIFSEDDLRSVFCIYEDGIYSPDAIRETAMAIQNLYGTYGYIDALVDFDPKLSCDAPCYDVHFIVEEGEQYRVGLIKVLGNCATQNTVILHECSMIPGEIFNIRKLKKTEEKLRNIGYFSCVNVYTVQSDETSCLGPNYRDVHIEVQETSTGNFSAFVGFSSMETAFGGLTISEKNFNYKGLGCLLRNGFGYLRGGGEYLSLTASVGTLSRKYGISWTKPFFNDTKWVVGFDVDKQMNRFLDDDYDIESWGFNIHAKYPINQFVRYGVYYRLRHEEADIKDCSNDKPPEKIGDRDLTEQEKTDWWTAHNLKLKRQHQAEESKGIISAVGTTLVYDSTDSPCRPTNGFRSGVELEFAGVGGDFRFISAAYVNTWYYPVTENTVFKTRADQKIIFPVFGTTYDTMPLDERLFLGGYNNIRGYKDYAIGPQFKCNCDEDDPRPRGGLNSTLVSLEYLWRYSKRWEPFVFFDAGQVSKHEFDWGQIKSSVGFGTRLTLFEGGPCVTLGIGFPIREHDEDLIRRFFFNVGGNF